MRNNHTAVGADLCIPGPSLCWPSSGIMYPGTQTSECWHSSGPTYPRILWVLCVLTQLSDPCTQDPDLWVLRWPSSLTHVPRTQTSECCADPVFSDFPSSSTHKGVNLCLKVITQAQQQRPESPTETLTWHVCKYKLHKLHQRNIHVPFDLFAGSSRQPRNPPKVQLSNLIFEQLQGLF